MGAVIIPGLSFATSPNPMFYTRLKSSSILPQSLPGCTVQQRHRPFCVFFCSLLSCNLGTTVIARRGKKKSFPILKKTSQLKHLS